MRLVDDMLELKYLFIDAKYDKDDVDESDAYRKSMDKFYNMAIMEDNMPTKGIDEKRLLTEFGRLKRKIQEQKEEREKQENERKQLLEDMEREREEMTKKGAKEKIRINKLEKENTDLRQQHTRILNAVEKQQNDLEELKKRNQRIREESIFSKIFNFFLKI